MFRIYIIIEIVCIICCLHFLYMYEMGGIHFKCIPNLALMLCQVFLFECIHLYGSSAALSWLMIPVIAAYTILEFGFEVKKVVVSNILWIVVLSLLQLMMRVIFDILKISSLSESQMAIIVYLGTLVFVFLLKNQLAHFFSMILRRSKVIAVLGILYAVYLLLSIIQFRKNGGISVVDFLIVFIFGWGICILAYKLQSERVKLDAIERNWNTYQNHEKNYEELLGAVRKKQHDFHNHIQAILSMCYTTNTYEKLVEQQVKYMNMVMQENVDYKLLNSQWPLLAGFLYSKIQEAMQQNIVVRYQVQSIRKINRIPEPVVIEMTGIIWDNAMEAVLEMENPVLYLDVDVSEKDKVQIIVINPIPEVNINDFADFFQAGYTTKEGHGGYGLTKIKEYSVRYQFEYIVRKKRIEDRDYFFMGLIL